ncbi:MAG TPA: RNA-splicing ligase RtcB, partial [Actinobacteria bacterium]|nr:RNA-splicing ligase RtcB [Actinomycetota bacterium]
PAGIPGGGASARGLAEETPGACKDANTMVQTAQCGGLCRKIPRLVPLGVVKG